MFLKLFSFLKRHYKHVYVHFLIFSNLCFFLLFLVFGCFKVVKMSSLFLQLSYLFIFFLEKVLLDIIPARVLLGLALITTVHFLYHHIFHQRVTTRYHLRIVLQDQLWRLTTLLHLHHLMTITSIQLVIYQEPQKETQLTSRIFMLPIR